ncbi:MAG: hypothetical protein LBH16_08800 [Treponema sp.]|nr:hypothetical protein [Treponema sp.]
MKNLQITAALTLVLCVSFTVCSCAKASGYEYAETAGRVKPSDKEAVRLYALASDEYSRGRFPETAEILRNEKKFPPSLMLRAKAEYFSGDIKKAETTCRRILKIRASSCEAKLYLARCLYEKGDPGTAVKICESLLADNPHDIKTLRFLSALSNETGKSGESMIYLDKAAELSAESALVLLDRARLSWTNGKSRAALEDLSRARAMLPWDTPLLGSITNLENLIKELM